MTPVSTVTATSIPGIPPGDLFSPLLAERLFASRLVAVITVEDPADAVPLARALVDGGIRAVELAWRSAATLEALAGIRRVAPELLLGIGTLLSSEQVRQVHEVGADFGVSPGLSPAVVEASRHVGLSYAPGVQTPSDVQAAVERGCRVLKFFPAETAGGLAHLRALHAPFAHLGMRFIALGGLTVENSSAYLRESCVGAIGGSWIAPANLVRQGKWDAIRQLAAAACERAARATKEGS